MQYGTVCAYWTKKWSIENYKYYAEKISGLGFDVMEIPAGDLLKMSDSELEDLKSLANSLKLSVSSNIGPPHDCNISSSNESVRKNGIEFLEKIIIQMEKLGSTKLVGALYNCWPYDFIDLDKPARWERAVKSVKTIADFAKKHNVALYLEILNRFETNLLNTSEEGVKFCKDVGRDNVLLLLDTFHMNIEEDDLAAAIIQAGDRIVNVHACDNNRKLPGMGHVNWREILLALHAAGYTGALATECFSHPFGVWTNDHRIWRSYVKDGIDQDLKRSMAYLHALERDL